MAASITDKLSRVERCRRNAQCRSDRARQAFIEALALMVKEGKPLVKAKVCQRAGVTPPFLRKHPDLLQLLEDAQARRLASRESVEAATSADKGKERVIEALKRQLDAKQAVINAKEAAVREKDRTISVLLGKLAANSPLSNSDLHQWLAEQTQRAEKAEERVRNLESRLFAKGVVRMRDKVRRLDKKGRTLPDGE